MPELRKPKSPILDNTWLSRLLGLIEGTASSPWLPARHGSEPRQYFSTFENSMAKYCLLLRCYITNYDYDYYAKYLLRLDF